MGRMGARARDARGQSTVEAAVALPVVFLLVLLLVQPGIVLYDRMVMAGAAAEGCRLLATSDGDAATCEEYVRRRLGAIPPLDVFHVHDSGCTWEVRCEGGGAADVARDRADGGEAASPAGWRGDAARDGERAGQLGGGGDGDGADARLVGSGIIEWRERQWKGR